MAQSSSKYILYLLLSKEKHENQIKTKHTGKILLLLLK